MFRCEHSESAATFYYLLIFGDHMERKLHFNINEAGKVCFGFEAVTDLSDMDIIDLFNDRDRAADCFWKSVKHDGLPKSDQIVDLLLYSKKHDVLCTGWWHDGVFDPEDGSLYYLRTEKSISHYMEIFKP